MKRSVILKPKISVQAKLIAYTGLLVTTVFWTQGTDPFNLPKLAILTIGAFSLIGGEFSSFGKIRIRKGDLPEVAVTGLICLGLLSSFLFSSAPQWQMIYGVYSRNTGMLCYAALLVLFLYSTRVRSLAELNFLVKFFMLASLIAISVALIEISGINIQGVDSNIQMALISTFGNSNFISAFLGMSGVVFFTYLIGFKSKILVRGLFLFLLIISISLILKSDSKQGLILLMVGCATTLGFYLLSKTQNKFLTISYFIFLTTGSIFGLAGFMNSGPLANLIYKSSVGFRFEYWKAGIEMFKGHPFTGVGLNSYGDWYRTARSQDAMLLPGTDVITNTAHNVYIDLAATGGLLLVAGFLVLIIATFCSAIKVILRKREFDVVFYSMFGAWLMYLLQATISIDQIGLAIWGWILPGSIIAYERISFPKHKVVDESPKLKEKTKFKSQLIPASTPLGVIGGFVLAVVVIFPPLKSDLNLRKAYGSTSAEQLIESAEEWPPSTFVSANVAAILLNNKLAPQALDITRNAIKINPRSFDLWNLTYSNPAATIEERTKALEMMKELDPKNAILKSKIVKE